MKKHGTKTGAESPAEPATAIVWYTREEWDAVRREASWVPLNVEPGAISRGFLQTARRGPAMQLRSSAISANRSRTVQPNPGWSGPAGSRHIRSDRQLPPAAQPPVVRQTVNLDLKEAG